MEESAIVLILEWENILFCLNAGVAVDGRSSLGKLDFLVFICCLISHNIWHIVGFIPVSDMHPSTAETKANTECDG